MRGGSSPLTRGKQERAPGSGPAHGLIPAHAGKTLGCVGRCVRRAAHPRSRGENPTRRPVDRSPRGLIPAHAGKTTRHARSDTRPRAHPRSRGENPRAPGWWCPWGGSSPLTRGKPRPHARRCRDRGIIPTHAGKTPRRACAAASVWDHPRSRGENFMFMGGPLPVVGSSPLTRGKHQPGRRSGDRSGLIPAHAGKTNVHEERSQRPRAHPPSRGENGTALTAAINPTGSSPLTRGKPASVEHVIPRSRLIPAHAGKTSVINSRSRRALAHPRSRGENTQDILTIQDVKGSSPLTRGKRCRCRRDRRRRRDHPRSRGENHANTMREVPEEGSSPLTRGKRVAAGVGPAAIGLIPAHAGKTSACPSGCASSPAHPRSRGENVRGRRPRWCPAGSSPLTRGKLVTATISILKLRLIPAHAGKTVSVRGGGFVAWAHPRSRGENIRPEGGSPSVRGSSPLTRGKLWVSTIPTDLKGLIPAHAGKTARQGPASRSPRAHPRSRGENRIAVPRASNRSGSSPLTRGKLYLGAQAFAARGLIPAHAGKTSLTSPTSLQAWAHPRSRGENFPASWSMLVPPGSSPLTRGKLTGTFAVREPVGLIPAHAGKTL